MRRPMPAEFDAIRDSADDRYAVAVELLGPAMARLAASVEGNPAERQDLLQAIHVELWRSLARFDGRCSLKTWVYRVAHNVAADHVSRAVRRQAATVSLEDADPRRAGARPSHEAEVSDRLVLERVQDLLRDLGALDRQVMLLYLEDESAATIAKVSGLSPGAVASVSTASSGFWPKGSMREATHEQDQEPLEGAGHDDPFLFP
ncbi:RNA polymerase sigma factor [Pseudorhizobium halotolerans]|nr:sigma-70 family RNA polymerase sigma factor [Pseudorhizobium halotolerans]